MEPCPCTDCELARLELRIAELERVLEMVCIETARERPDMKWALEDEIKAKGRETALILIAS